MVAWLGLRAGGVGAWWKGAASVMVLIFMLALVSSMPMRESEEDRSGNYLDEQLAIESAAGFPWDDDDTGLHKIVDMQYETMPLGVRVTRRSGSINFPMVGSTNLRSARAMRGWRENKRQVRFRQCYFNPISCFRK